MEGNSTGAARGKRPLVAHRGKDRRGKGSSHLTDKRKTSSLGKTDPGNGGKGRFQQMQEGALAERKLGNAIWTKRDEGSSGGNEAKGKKAGGMIDRLCPKKGKGKTIEVALEARRGIGIRR